jgi:hypothetical protein
MEQRSFSGSEDFDTVDFTGRFLLGWPGVILFGVTFFFFWVVTDGFKRAANVSDALILSSTTLFVWGFAGLQLFYFTISGEDLIIRNHIFRWIRKRYALKDIQIVVLEKANGRFPCALRVKSTVTRAWSFFARGLSDTDWDELDKTLRKRGFPVDNKQLGR